MGMTRASRGSIARKSLASAILASSAIAPASSTPVGPAPMTREAQQTAPFVLVLLRLGMLECKQDPSPDSSCVLGLLETRCEGLSRHGARR
jgi:hypothetical protein